MEIVLPRLAKVITLWEYLLMKVERGSNITGKADTPKKSYIPELYQEFETLHKQVEKVCQQNLKPTTVVTTGVQTTSQSNAKMDAEASSNILQVIHCSRHHITL